jgi:hypothetical protein
MPSCLRLYPILAALSALLLSGCDDGGGSGHTNLRLVNVSPGYDSLDLYANTADDDTDRQRVAGVTYQTVSSYTQLESGTYNVKFKRSGVTSTLLTVSGRAFADDTHHTFVAFGSAGHFASLQIDDDVAPPTAVARKCRC